MSTTPYLPIIHYHLRGPVAQVVLIGLFYQYGVYSWKTLTQVGTQSIKQYMNRDISSGAAETIFDSKVTQNENWAY